jgi:heavy metal sensor kinase
VALVVFGGVFYFGLRYLLYSALDDSLRGRAELLEGGISYNDGELSVSAIGPEDSDDQFLRVTAAGGQVILDTSFEFDEPVTNAAGVAAAFDGRENLRWTHPDDDPVRILSVPIERDGEIVGVIEAAAETEIDETLGLVARLLAISVPLILLFAAGGGYWLARRALDPIDRITSTAAGIGERDLSQRIDLALPDDELGRLARTFNAMLERIEGAFERQRRFTADAAHELRTPLALMRSQIDLALAGRAGIPANTDTLESLGADVDRLTRLTTALLTLARGDAYGLEIAREQVDLPDMLDLVAEQYAPLAAERGIEIGVDAEPVALQADGDRLIQVLVNLMDNALRHAPDGSRIELGCRRAGSRASFWIADQGPGIPAEHLPHIFERFYRVDYGRARERGGAGLGLAISKMIVEAHGGAIRFDTSQPGSTRVVVELPAG